MMNFKVRNALLRKSVSLDDIGGSALYLFSDLSGGVTGEVHCVDAGFNITSMPVSGEMKKFE